MSPLLSLLCNFTLPRDNSKNVVIILRFDDSVHDGIVEYDMKSKTVHSFSYLPHLTILLVVALVILIFLLFTQAKSNVLGTTDTATTSVSPTNKELYIPLGTGTNITKEWTDVKGAAVYIDTRLYSKMKKVTFEVSVGIPSGSQIVHVRLYNATDNHPVWYSEMSMSGSGPELLTSSGITLDNGNKLYQVQMKSQLGVSTNLLQSRIHITTN